MKDKNKERITHDKDYEKFLDKQSELLKKQIDNNKDVFKRMRDK